MHSTAMTERKITLITEKKAKEISILTSEATLRFRGNIHHLEMAIGMLTIGRELGWKPLLLIHDKKTIRRSEEILGVNFRELFPEIGKNADKSVAWKLVQKASNFWKAVRGETKGIRTNQAE